MMLDYTTFKSLLESHRYQEAAAEARRLQGIDAEDIGPLECLAEASLALGDYNRALPLYSRVDTLQRSDATLSRGSGRRIWISSTHWMLGNRAEAIHLMTEMVDGILNGSIEFGDAAGGVKQGPRFRQHDGSDVGPNETKSISGQAGFSSRCEERTLSPMSSSTQLAKSLTSS
jgi:hypothetical protein